MAAASALRVAVINQAAGGGATAVAREILEWGPRHGVSPRYWPEGPAGSTGELLRELEVFDPHVIHAHCWYQGYDYDLLRRLAPRRPVVFTVHDTFVVNQFGVECWECWRNPWCLGCPALGPLRRWRPNHRILERLRKRRVNRATPMHLVCPSRWMARRLARSELGSRPTEVIPNGIDLERFSPGPPERGRLGLPDGPLVLFVGNMYGPGDHRKGLPDLLRALAPLRTLLPGAHLALAGRIHLEALPSGVVALGDVPREDLPALYRSADVFCLPTLGDNQPMTVLEAMGCGVPVVATSVGGLPELVDDPESGALVPAGDVAALADALGALLLDAGRRARCGAAGRARAVLTHGRERAAERHVALYRRLVDAG